MAHLQAPCQLPNLLLLLASFPHQVGSPVRIAPLHFAVLGVLWLHASYAEVFRDAVFTPPLWAASPSSSSLQCLDSLAYITVFPSFHMAKPAQSALSDLSHQFSHLHFSPDDSVFNAIKSRFSQEKPQHFHLCYLHLSLLALGHCHCFHTI